MKADKLLEGDNWHVAEQYLVDTEPDIVALIKMREQLARTINQKNKSHIDQLELIVKIGNLLKKIQGHHQDMHTKLHLQKQGGGFTSHVVTKFF